MKGKRQLAVVRQRKREMWLWPVEILRISWRKGMEKLVMHANIPIASLNYSQLGTSASRLRSSWSFTWDLQTDWINVLWKDILPLLMWCLFHIFLWIHSSAWWLPVWFPRLLWVLLLSEVGYVKSDTFVQNRVGAFTVIAEKMAWQILLWLPWCGSSYHVLVCGKQFSSVLKENHREHSVLPTDEETIGELNQSV